MEKEKASPTTALQTFAAWIAEIEKDEMVRITSSPTAIIFVRNPMRIKKSASSKSVKK